jgi:hypothetical protein
MTYRYSQRFTLYNLIFILPLRTHKCDLFSHYPNWNIYRSLLRIHREETPWLNRILSTGVPSHFAAIISRPSGHIEAVDYHNFINVQFKSWSSESKHFIKMSVLEKSSPVSSLNIPPVMNIFIISHILLFVYKFVWYDYNWNFRMCHIHMDVLFNSCLRKKLRLRRMYFVSGKINTNYFGRYWNRTNDLLHVRQAL